MTRTPEGVTSCSGVGEARHMPCRCCSLNGLVASIRGGAPAGPACDRLPYLALPCPTLHPRLHAHPVLLGSGT